MGCVICLVVIMLGKALIFVAIPFVLTTLFSRMLGVRSTANDMYIK